MNKNFTTTKRLQKERLNVLKFQNEITSSERFYSLARQLNTTLAEISNLEVFQKEVKTNNTEFNWWFENSKTYIQCASPLQGYRIEYGTVKNGEHQKNGRIYPMKHLLADADYAREKEALVNFMKQFQQDCKVDLALKLHNDDQVKALQQADKYIDVSQLEEKETPELGKHSDEMEL